MAVITSSPDYRASGVRKSNLNIFLSLCHLWLHHELYITAVFHLHQVLPNMIYVMYVWSFVQVHKKIWQLYILLLQNVGICSL
jgi:hypothetical protein